MRYGPYSCLLGTKTNKFYKCKFVEINKDIIRLWFLIAIEEDLHVIVTVCIRKQDINATPLEHFPKPRSSKPSNIDREHFLQLDVIISKHHIVYAQKNFQTGVRTLLILRQDFNEPENVFCVSKDINHEKKIFTECFLNGTSLPGPISDELRLYIKEASDVALPYVKKLMRSWDKEDDIQVVLSELKKYVQWLQSL